MEEIWKDIEGYEGLYQVSNLGNVRSLNWRKIGKVKNLYLKKQNRGYLHVELTKDGVRKAVTVHRLVATAFLPNPLNLPVINHIDENKENNRVDNLEWCTSNHNMMCYYKNHGWNVKEPYNGKRRNGKRLHLQIEQFSKDGELIAKWENSVQIKAEKGWSDWSISECCRGNRKTAYGYIWRYAS